MCSEQRNCVDFLCKRVREDPLDPGRVLRRVCGLHTFNNGGKTKLKNFIKFFLFFREVFAAGSYQNPRLVLGRNENS